MFFKEISELGIMVVICGIFLYFAKTIFDYMLKDIKENYEEISVKLEYAEQRRSMLITGNEKLVEVLSRLESRLRTEKITGKALETVLNTKASQICQCVKNEVIDVINSNNIDKNWNSIEAEMDILFDGKILRFQKDYQTLMEFEIFAELNLNFIDELNSAKKEVLSILEKLKEATELTEYRISIRKISAELDKTKKNMQREVTRIING